MTSGWGWDSQSRSCSSTLHWISRAAFPSGSWGFLWGFFGVVLVCLGLFWFVWGCFGLFRVFALFGVLVFWGCFGLLGGCFGLFGVVLFRLGLFWFGLMLFCRGFLRGEWYLIIFLIFLPLHPPFKSIKLGNLWCVPSLGWPSEPLQECTRTGQHSPWDAVAREDGIRRKNQKLGWEIKLYNFWIMVEWRKCFPALPCSGWSGAGCAVLCDWQV